MVKLSGLNVPYLQFLTYLDQSHLSCVVGEVSRSQGMSRGGVGLALEYVLNSSGKVRIESSCRLSSSVLSSYTELVSFLDDSMSY